MGWVADGRSARRWMTAGAMVLALSAGACSRTGGGEITGSIANPFGGRAQQPAQPLTQAEARVRLDQLGARYDRNPGEKRISIDYAQALRDQGRIAQAIAVLQNAAIKRPGDKELMAAYGKALADGGRFMEAREVLQQSHTPDRPNWRTLSAQGAVADQMGRHGEAQEYYAAALRLQPGDPAILSNLGLSLALSNQLPQAEQALRQAYVHPRADNRVRANLALVLGLQGRFREAEEMASRDLPPEDAAANMAYLRGMVGQQNSWNQLRQMDQRAGGRPAQQPMPPRQASATGQPQSLAPTR
jgi:Flp pilus assembly protein TadD